MINLWSYMTKTITDKDIKCSIQSILSVVEDYYFDMKHGTETMRWVELNTLDIKSENRKRGLDTSQLE